MLDALNEDCRRLVLSYVPVQDLLRAERVSRSWQTAVLQYLRSVRIRIDHPLHDYEKTHGPDCHILKLEPDAIWFENVTTKLGSSIVASYCYNECTLLDVIQNCPILEHLALIGIAQDDLSLTEQVFNINRLKQITFKYFMGVDDNCIRKFLGNYTLEELTIFSNVEVTGQCLSSLPTSLKSLRLICSKGLRLHHVLSGLNRLPTLTKLELTKLAPEILQNVHLMLSLVPKLEELSLNFDETIELKEDISQSISRLNRLKCLDLSMNPNVTDDWLVAVRRGCWQLEELNVSECSVTANAVVALCRAMGSALTTLSVASISTVSDCHVLNIIESCPNLKFMDISYCRVTVRLTVAVGQLCSARARPLRLLATHTSLQQPEELFPGFILDFGDSDSYLDSDNSEENDSDWPPE